MADLNNEEQNQDVAPVAPERRDGVTPSVSTSSCGNNNTQVLCPCVGNYIPAGSAQKVYAIGTLGYDFGSEARRDSFKQRMEQGFPEIPENLLAHLGKFPFDSGALMWTLNIHATPIYAIAPTGPFAQEGFQLLWKFLKGQVNNEKERIERISLPGIITGQTMLMNGHVVPVVSPDIRGLYGWTSDALVKQTQNSTQKNTGVDIKNFLERVYYELENMGVTSEERAMNFAATKAFNVARIFGDAVNKSLNMASIDIKKSAICRPGSDCQDVILRFFDPKNKTERAVQMYRFTVDVRDVLPVTVGEVHSWNEY
ncbi:MAG: hypothetical protein QG657_4042 [Acidobacteriota bacterium]|nr:hypothetical protein [Acidobacteriota bacterium]